MSLKTTIIFTVFSIVFLRTIQYIFYFTYFEVEYFLEYFDT